MTGKTIYAAPQVVNYGSIADLTGYGNDQDGCRWPRHNKTWGGPSDVYLRFRQHVIALPITPCAS